MPSEKRPMRERVDIRRYSCDRRGRRQETRVFDLKPACRGAAELIGRIADGELDAPTPCPDYTVGELIDHIDHVTRGATALALDDGDTLANADPEPVHLEPDWRDRVGEHLQALGAAWEDPDAWEGRGEVPGSDLSNETWAKIALTELVVHGWDLARATRRPFILPETTLRTCLDHVAAFVPNAPVPGLWGAPVAVGPDAPLLDRIVAITGRTP
jgi:uncharacterized protein (TIGR03086 family)